MPDITFSIEQQKQDQWCWAAVALSICRFYSDHHWRGQCDLVNDIFSDIRGNSDCCQNGDTFPCNMTWSLRDVLSTSHHLALPVRGIVSFGGLMQEIEVGQRPVAARIMFSDLNTAHYIVLVGCAQTLDGKQWVKVADPSMATGNTTSIEYSTILANYRPGAIWDESYFTT